ncbi:hypothetical protein TRVL_06587 [Trypanosoma vivax]|nr:hypothetical protein TRVL_06587 [Trypanosoma vivax]
MMREATNAVKAARARITPGVPQHGAETNALRGQPRSRRNTEWKSEAVWDKRPKPGEARRKCAMQRRWDKNDTDMPQAGNGQKRGKWRGAHMWTTGEKQAMKQRVPTC